MLALQSKQQIVVALHCDLKLKTLFTYNISNRCWKKLAHHFDLQPGYPFSIYRSPVAVGYTLYWGVLFSSIEAMMISIYMHVLTI